MMTIVNDYELENLRRSVAMAPPESPAPITCRQLFELLAEIQAARAERDRA
jgi:hypothetical protein